MLKTEHRQGRAVVKVVSDITEELAIELVAHIRRLRDEGFHERVDLEIASNGGSVLALGYFLDALDRFHASGLEVVTRALTSAASAAADLVALGDRREASGARPSLPAGFGRHRAAPPVRRPVRLRRAHLGGLGP